MLWIVVDLLGTLDDFLEHHIPFAQVLRYYLMWFPEALVQIIPMSLLLGLLFCLSNLGRRNELLAMRAGGVSLWRLAVPLLGVGVGASLVVLVLNNFFVPAAHARTRALRNVFHGKTATDQVRNIFYMDLVHHRDWYAVSYNSATRVLENLEIHEHTAAGGPLCDIYAERAQWIDRQWHFFNVEVQEQTPDAQVLLRHAAETNFPALTDPPRQLLLQNKRPDEMTSGDLRRFIRTRRPTRQLAIYRVTLHYRYAFPWSCLMVAWIAVPLGMSTRRSGALRSVGLALGLVVAFYFVTNIALAYGDAGKIEPVLAAWLANLLLAVVGGVLFLRLR